MNEFSILALSLVTGIALGVFYFGGLWLTLKRLPYTQQPVLLTVGSFFGRTAVCLSCFYLVIRITHLEGLLLSLAGFISMKLVLVRSLRPDKSQKHSVKEEMKW